MTQCERIIQYIETFGSITTREAFNDLDIARLASRIHDLTREGYVFDRDTVKSKNRFGKVTHYTRYSMGGES